MIVMRLIMLSFGWLALLLVAGITGAHAQDCGPGAIRDAYRAAEAAYGRKDFTAAAALFRPLAEQGLGPAQLRLSQIIAAGTGKPDLMEAYRWPRRSARCRSPRPASRRRTGSRRISAPV